MDPQLQVLFSFFQRLHRKAPGSESSTRRALSMLSDLPKGPAIVEFGCGSGAAALVLAAAGADVTPVDIHQPFLNELSRRAEAEGCAVRVHPVCGDMAAPPFAEQSFDAIWSEGAIYLIGFAAGLRCWRPLLKPGGYVAISEATWLVDEPPQQAIDFWKAEGASITTAQQNRETLRSSGYSLVGDFTLPKQDWTDYYTPLQTELDQFRGLHPSDTAIQEFADSMQREIELWYDCGHSYGYVFYLAQKAP